MASTSASVTPAALMCGCEVVGRDLGARHEQALLARPGRLDAAVEEVGDVGVLLGLGDVELAPAEARDDLREARHDDRREGDLDRQARLVLGQRHDRAGRGASAPRSKPAKSSSTRAWVSWRARSARKLKWTTTSPSRTRPSTPAMMRRLDELVVLAARVGRRERRRRVGGRLRPEAAAVDHGLVPGLRALPALVAVHAVVAPADGGDARARVSAGQAGLEVREEAVRRAGRRVPPVEQAVDDDVRRRRPRGPAPRWRPRARRWSGRRRAR